MNESKTIMDACYFCISKGIKIKGGGSYLEISNGNIISVDPLIACLIYKNKINEDYSNIESLVRPGFIKLICQILGVDAFWIRKFWLGFDRQYQILILDENEKEIGQDDVSKFGIHVFKSFKSL